MADLRDQRSKKETAIISPPSIQRIQECIETAEK
jgi:hypothetical protein